VVTAISPIEQETSSNRKTAVARAKKIIPGFPTEVGPRRRRRRAKFQWWIYAMLNVLKIGLAAALLASVFVVMPRRVEAVGAPFAPPPFEGSLSVLTYNVKGLPWPVTQSRTAALDRIGERLRAEHARGIAPQVVVLQESFTDEAQAIGAAAGYRYVAHGPSAGETNDAAMSAADQGFASASRWWNGETEGKHVGSGLMVLSDYPIVATRRIAFPAFACAGFDCLANKGALLVTLAIPGAKTPVDVITTHLNSRKASHVADARSIYAYRSQVAALTGFIRRAHDPRFPLIVAGDFNIGSAPARRTALLQAARGEWTPGSEVDDALGAFREQGGDLTPDAVYTQRRARDWQFFADGTGAGLRVTGISVPFGHEPDGSMLSDHIGYVARYRLEAATSSARPKA
jgi:endonuclease/exonuclease/phosphatase family metal-dependent hydrolase